MPSEHTAASRPIDVLRDETSFRITLVAWMQSIGVVTIIVGRSVYCSAWQTRDWVGVVLVSMALLLALAMFFANSDVSRRIPIWLLDRLRWDPNPLEKNWIANRAMLAIILFDAIVCAILVSLTGGFIQSYLSPLLLSIIATGFTLRLSHRSLAAVVLTVVLCVAGVWVMYAHRSWLYHGTGLSLDPLPGHPQRALVATLLLSNLLTVLGAAEWLRNPPPSHLISRACNRLTEWIVSREHIQVWLMWGMRGFSQDISRRLDSGTLSEVHGEGALLEQAIVLAIPHGERDRSGTREYIAYATYMTHWIDDVYDLIYSGLGRLPDADGSFSLPKALRKSRYMSSLYRKMRRRLSEVQLRNRWAYDRWAGVPFVWEVTRPAMKIFHRLAFPSEWSEWATEIGMSRIVLNAMLQRASDGGAIEILLRVYVGILQGGEVLPSFVLDAYRRWLADERCWIVIWGTGKTALEIFDCASESFSPGWTELFSILYAPIMVFQDIGDELECEISSGHFKLRVLRQPEGTEWDIREWFDQVAIPLADCIQLFREGAGLLGAPSDGVVEDRRRQCQALMSLYGSRLPIALQTKYKALLGDKLFWKGIPVTRSRNSEMLQSAS